MRLLEGATHIQIHLNKSLVCRTYFIVESILEIHISKNLIIVLILKIKCILKLILSIKLIVNISFIKKYEIKFYIINE